MDSLHLDANSYDLEELNKLSIESIGSVYVRLSDGHTNMREFCEITDSLFKDMAISKSCTADVCFVYSLDTHILHWKNVTNLSVTTLTISDLAELLSNMPQVESLFILECRNRGIERKLVSRLTKSEPKLKLPEIEEFLHVYDEPVPIYDFMSVL